jgi:hypothetical protein
MSQWDPQSLSDSIYFNHGLTDDAGEETALYAGVDSRADAMDAANSDTRQETATTRPTKATVMETEIITITTTTTTTTETKKEQERNLFVNTLESVIIVAKPVTRLKRLLEETNFGQGESCNRRR